MALSPHTSRASEGFSFAVSEEEERPVRCAKFRQQELWAWKPVWSPKVVIIMYLIVSLIFVPLGVVVFIQSTRMVSTMRIRYDQAGACDIGPGPFAVGEEPSETCTFPVTVERDIKGPAFFYYGMVNFYQNARRYVESRSDDQLRGNEVTLADAKSVCDPLTEDPDNPGEVLFPCGLVAQSKFNDSFDLCRDSSCTDRLDWTDENIAWEIDREQRFLASDNNTPDQNELVTDENFMVWMRLSTYRNWKKLYRIIPGGISAGTYTVRATSRFPVSGFDGEKFFFISETTWFGGPNKILGLGYIVVGSVALVLAIAFLVRSRASPDLQLPPETTVHLEGISPAVKPRDEDEGADAIRTSGFNRA